MRRLAGLFIAFMLSFVAMGAFAVPLPFDRAAFDRAVAAGGPVVVQFHADWCPTCKAQAPIVAQLLQEPKFKNIKFFVANFDKEKVFKKWLDVSTQSTFVVFTGGQEVGRSIGQTTRSDIERTFSKAL